MTNMSYCRFQNTLSDLRDCKHTLDEMNENASREVDPTWDEDPNNDQGESFAKLGSDEAAAAINLIQLARDIVDEFGDDDEFMIELDNAHKSDR